MTANKDKLDYVIERLDDWRGQARIKAKEAEKISRLDAHPHRMRERNYAKLVDILKSIELEQKP